MTYPAVPSESTTVNAATVSHLRAGRRDDALGVASPTPPLSWQITDAAPGWQQSAYEIECRGADGVHTTGRVASRDSVQLPWPFAALTSRARVQIRVRAWDTNDVPTPGALHWTWKLGCWVLTTGAPASSRLKCRTALATVPPRIHRAARRCHRAAVRDGPRRVRGASQRPAGR
ncbi:hypothetical protein ACFSC4_29630 [Deinococcus malanensis]|uniref:glycoside hydrolase family 78 protein n=1 Tax=Deinococcus malanensis TaxID=1706855 RepID=UPI00362DD262